MFSRLSAGLMLLFGEQMTWICGSDSHYAVSLWRRHGERCTIVYTKPTHRETLSRCTRMRSAWFAAILEWLIGSIASKSRHNISSGFTHILENTFWVRLSP